MIHVRRPATAFVCAILVSACGTSARKTGAARTMSGTASSPTTAAPTAGTTSTAPATGAAASSTPAASSPGTAAPGTTAAAGSASAAGHRGMMGGGMMGGGMSMMHGAAAMHGGAATSGTPTDTAEAPRPGTAAFSGAAGCPAATPALLEQGRRVFGTTGNCRVCHGDDARGTSLAPNLTDTRWLDIDGSYGSIVDVVRHGVRHARTHPAPMPALGGAKLDDSQVCAVAAYVYSLSHH